MTLKFMNYASADDFPRIQVEQAARDLLKLRRTTVTDDADSSHLLSIFREMEKKESWVSPLPR